MRLQTLVAAPFRRLPKLSAKLLSLLSQYRVVKSVRLPEAEDPISFLDRRAMNGLYCNHLFDFGKDGLFP